MADEVLKRDENRVVVLGGVTDDANEEITMLRVDPTTKRLLVSAAGGSGSGTVTTVSVSTANGFAGSVANATTTPAITLTTTITGLLEGNGTAISAATTTGTGSVVRSTSPTLVTPILGTPTSGTLTNCTGLPLTGITGLGTGVATALGVNTGTSGSFVVNGGALGTPTSGTVTNLTGTASININGTVGATTPNTGAFTTISASSTITAAIKITGGTPGLGKVLTSDADGDATWETPSNGGALWTLMPGTPTRVGNTSFTVTGDVTAYVAKGMIIKWTESGTVRCAMVSIPSTFSSPNTTITIIGDTMTSIDASSLKYCMLGAEMFQKNFAVAGTIGATGTDVANAYYATEPMRVIGADLQVGTAGTTNSTTIDINKNGTSVFTTKPTLASTVASSPTPFTSDSATSLALGDRVSIDIDAIQTTQAVDLYVNLYVFPTRYLNL